MGKERERSVDISSFWLLRFGLTLLVITLLISIENAIAGRNDIQAFLCVIALTTFAIALIVGSIAIQYLSGFSSGEEEEEEG